jgi:hypothetical protein
MHAVQQLYLYRKNLSTTEFNARGKKVKRCEQCRLAKQFCICALKPKTKAQQECKAAFALIMYNSEVLKPSNTGRLIADILPDCFAFLWSRTEVDEQLTALLADSTWQPIIVFPAQYASETQTVYQQKADIAETKRPLYIMLDGTWREAKKMFRKSAYLADFPVLSIVPEAIKSQHIFEETPLDIAKQFALNTDTDVVSNYQLRTAAVSNQLATAEVAAEVLRLSGEQVCGDLLSHWLNVFSYRYQQAVCQKNLANPQAVAQFTDFIANLALAE